MAACYLLTSTARIAAAAAQSSLTFAHRHETNSAGEPRRAILPAPLSVNSRSTAADVEKLARALASDEFGLYRAKGFARDTDGQLHAIQVVGQRWTTCPAASHIETGIVCIGPKGGTTRKQIDETIALALFA